MLADTKQSLYSATDDAGEVEVDTSNIDDAQTITAPSHLNITAADDIQINATGANRTVVKVGTADNTSAMTVRNSVSTPLFNVYGNGTIKRDIRQELISYQQTTPLYPSNGTSTLVTYHVDTRNITLESSWDKTTGVFTNLSQYRRVFHVLFSTSFLETNSTGYRQISVMYNNTDRNERSLSKLWYANSYNSSHNFRGVVISGIIALDENDTIRVRVTQTSGTNSVRIGTTFTSRPDLGSMIHINEIF